MYRECGAGLDSQSRIHKQENATKELLAAAEALNSLFIYCLALCLSKLSYISFAVERLEHTSRFGLKIVTYPCELFSADLLADFSYFQIFSYDF